MKKLTSWLRILQSTWGISIKITASDVPWIEFEEMDNRDEYVVKKVNSHLHLGVNKKYDSRFRSDYLYDAIKSISPMLEEMITSDTIVLVDGLFFGNSDFQEEGLYSAMLLWLKERYQLQIDLPDVKYDGRLNRYIFDF